MVAHILARQEEAFRLEKNDGMHSRRRRPVESRKRIGLVTDEMLRRQRIILNSRPPEFGREMRGGRVHMAISILHENATPVEVSCLGQSSPLGHPKGTGQDRVRQISTASSTACAGGRP